jgi:enoyl-CoA hydratase
MTLVQRTELEEGVVCLRLNRPERLNALVPALVMELHSHLDEVRRDDETRVVVLTGAGRGFCAGADLKAEGEVAAPERYRRPGVIGTFRLAELYSDLVLRLRTLGKPVIAAVNGAATGGGLALVLGSDIRIAARSARFAVSFVRAGFSGCDMGTSWLLPRIVGAGHAHELLLTGREVEAGEARAMGLVIDVVADESLMDRVVEEARLITRNTPWGAELTKEVMWSNLEIAGLHAAIDLENRTQAMTTTTSDSAEARRAWLERRPPRFELR